MDFGNLNTGNQNLSLSGTSVKDAIPWFVATVDPNIPLNWRNFTHFIPYVLVSDTVPGVLTNTKELTFYEKQIVGSGQSEAVFGGGKNERITFSIEFVHIGNQLTSGIMNVESFLSMLREPIHGGAVTGLTSLAKKVANRVGLTQSPVHSLQFKRPPLVLYQYGTGKGHFPLLYSVVKCDYKLSEANKWGVPQIIEADFDLRLEKDNPLYKGYEMRRNIVNAMTTAGSIKSALTSASFTAPYYKERLL